MTNVIKFEIPGIVSRALNRSCCGEADLLAAKIKTAQQGALKDLRAAYQAFKNKPDCTTFAAAVVSAATEEIKNQPHSCIADYMQQLAEKTTDVVSAILTGWINDKSRQQLAQAIGKELSQIETTLVNEQTAARECAQIKKMLGSLRGPSLAVALQTFQTDQTPVIKQYAIYNTELYHLIRASQQTADWAERTSGEQSELADDASARVKQHQATEPPKPIYETLSELQAICSTNGLIAAIRNAQQQNPKMTIESFINAAPENLRAELRTRLPKSP